MRVTNINAATQNSCACGSWLEHWKKFSGQVLSKWCSERRCTKAPEFGARVQKGGSSDQGWYVVPLCDKHDGLTGMALDLVEGVRLTPANAHDTSAE